MVINTTKIETHITIQIWMNFSLNC